MVTLQFPAGLRRSLRFLVLGPLVRAVASFPLGVEEALATERGSSREEHLRRGLARVDDRDAGGLIRVAIPVQAPLELQIALFLVRVARVVANVVEVAALGHFGQRKVLLIHLQVNRSIITMILSDVTTGITDLCARR